MGRSPEEGSSSKRWRPNDDHATCRQKHLYHVLDDCKDGYSIHKLDADDMEPFGHLPEPAALRLAAPVLGSMAFAALGTNIFIDTSPRRRRDRASPTLVYDTATAALVVGPHLPDQLYNLGAAMAAGERLHAVTTVCLGLHQNPSMQVLSQKVEEPWDPTLEWSWNSQPAPPPPPPPFNGNEIVSYALHPDGRTVFMSTSEDTHAFDATSHGLWRDLGDWVLPFRGQAYFDGDLGAWVGIHHEEDGHVCCCQVASRSAAAATTRPPECRVLREKLFRGKEEVKPGHWHLRPTLTYMGDGGFCLVESIMRSRRGFPRWLGSPCHLVRSQVSSQGGVAN